MAIVRGGWWLGDAGLFLTVLGSGTAAAYVTAAVLNPDIGSYADQGALGLILLGALVSLAAIVLSLLRGRKDARDGAITDSTTTHVSDESKGPCSVRAAAG